MKPEDRLSALLRTWRHDPAPAPEFAAGVWARIAAAPAAPAPMVPWSRLALPLAAALALVAGVGTGAAANRAQRADRFAAAYVRTIDPIQMSPSSILPAHHVHR